MPHSLSVALNPLHPCLLTLSGVWHWLAVGLQPLDPPPHCQRAPDSPASPTCWVARLCHNHMKSHFPGVSPHLGKPAESPARPRPAAGTPGEINAAGGASPPCSNQDRAPSAGDRAQRQPWSSQAQPVTHRSRNHQTRAASRTHAAPPEALPSSTSVSSTSRSLASPLGLRAKVGKQNRTPAEDGRSCGKGSRSPAMSSLTLLSTQGSTRVTSSRRPFLTVLRHRWPLLSTSHIISHLSSYLSSVTRH